MQKDAESGPFDRASVRKSLPEKEFHHRFAISYRLEKKSKRQLLASRMSPIELPPMEKGGNRITIQPRRKATQLKPSSPMPRYTKPL